MVVSRANFEEVLAKLAGVSRLALDCETTGLRPYHGDRLFSIILATPDEGFYFNFQPYQGLDPEYLLGTAHLDRLRPFFADPFRHWDLFNAKYDMHILQQERIELAGEVHCTKAIAFVEYNDHQSYDLEACAARIGETKSDAVDKFITENKLTEKRQGATQEYTHKFFDRVPFDVIAPYGETDGVITARLARHQEEALQRIADETPKNLPTVLSVFRNEKRLTRTVFRVERVGVRIDRPYCVRAARYEADRAEKAVAAFERETGRPLRGPGSGKSFPEVFAGERDKWEFTKKGNPSFESDVLAKFAHPAAKLVLEFRDAQAKANFYQGFLYHADGDDVVHPNFNPDGAAHGRFSSSNPNFQNLTSEEGEEAQEFLVRRAIIPRPGFVFIMPDYDQMEYRMMFDVACVLAGQESAIVKKIKEGFDPHQATADTVSALGTPLTRSRAKNGNFAFLYGSGDKTLADTIGSTVEEARKLKALLRQASPEVANYVATIMATAERRGFIFNWLGRRCYFPDKRFAYRAPNYHISGGCADVVKVVMNKLDDYFLSMKSRMVLTVHDELPCEIHESELAEAPRRVKEIMESVYPWKYLPLTAGMEWSDKSLADKRKGFPV